ncbi:MAG: penicillin-binding protein activator [Desulfurococcales archaeon]|nr:penicillin-binding protein activator [Desulfurococcales archaeon]
MDAKALAAAIIIIIIIAGAAAYVAMKGKGTTTTTSSQTTSGAQTSSTAGGTAGGKTATVKIGALLPLTGDLGSFGKSNEYAIEMAANDLNKYLAEHNAGFQVKIVVVDTETNPTKALQQFDTLYSQGIRFFIGPMSSAELSQIVSAIQQGKKAVVISQSSTAPSLAIKDTVFRFPPPDNLQGKVLAKLYKDDGKKYVIIAYRNDDWGKGLANAISGYAKQEGINVYKMIPYDPKAANFDNLVQSIATAVQDLEKQGVPDSQIGVEIIGFDEVGSILKSANSYDVLKKVQWYGSDGTALSQSILQNPDAVAFAEAVNWKNTVTFSLTNKTKPVYCALEKKLGYPPDPYSLIAYDAVWVMGLAIQKAGGPKATPDQVANAIWSVVQTYQGVTGKIVLNQYGDRKVSDYGIFVIKTVNGHPQWVLYEIYKYQTDSFQKVNGNPLQCS